MSSQVFDPPFGPNSIIEAATFQHCRRSSTSRQQQQHTATAMTTTAMYPNNDALGERLRLYVEEHFHDA